MITGSGTGNAATLQGGINGIPPDSLENAAQIDTGETGHIALLFSPDYGTQAGPSFFFFAITRTMRSKPNVPRPFAATSNIRWPERLHDKWSILW